MHHDLHRHAERIRRHLEETFKGIEALLTVVNAGVIKINTQGVTTSMQGLVTLPIVFSPAITMPSPSYSFTINAIFAGSPDNPGNDPQNAQVTPVFAQGQTSTRRGNITFNLVAGLGQQSYAVGVSITNISTGQVLSSDNCIIPLSS